MGSSLSLVHRDLTQLRWMSLWQSAQSVKLSKEQSPRNKRALTGNHCHKISTSRLLLPTFWGFKINSTTRPTNVHCLTGARAGKTIVPPRAEGDVTSSVEQCEKEGVILCTVPK